MQYPMSPNWSPRLPAAEALEPRRLWSTTPNDPYFAQQWALTQSAATDAWDSGTGSASVVVADIDTGVDYTHPDLYRNIWINKAEIPRAVRRRLRDADGDGRISFWDLNDARNAGRVGAADGNGNGYIDAADLLARYRRDGTGGWADGKNGRSNPNDSYVDDIVGWDFAGDDNNPFDYNGHGTHTAGTIAATGNDATGVSGVAWKVSLMPLKVFDDVGEGATAEDIAAAIRYAADSGARASNNSYGSQGGPGDDPIYSAIDYARRKGHLLVFAAGNDGVDNDFSRWASYPASYDLDNIISVAAGDQNGDLAYWSNYGATSVDLAAPGVDILSTWTGGGYQSVSGTSMAAPHVTGAVALMLAREPGLSNSELKSRLIDGADQTSALLGTSVSGGTLNVVNAVNGTAGRRAEAEAPPTLPPEWPPPWFWFAGSRGVPVGAEPAFDEFAGRSVDVDEV
jgi:serine protease